MSDAQAREPSPLVILAGGARKDEVVAGQKDRIAGPKGITVRLGGRPLIDVVVERFASAGCFDPIVIAGPAERYGERRGLARVVDTDVDFSGNIRAAWEALRAEGRSGPIFFASCDVLPEPDELRRVMDDWYAHRPLDFWYPVSRVPEARGELGASAYKRQYLIAPEGESEPVATLPGHLLALDPEAMRRSLIFGSFELAYRSRTQPVAARFVYIIAGVLLQILREDVRAIFSGRLPLFTVEVFWNAPQIAWGLARGGISQTRLERLVRPVFATRRHRRRYPDRGGRLPVVDALSLARDIDTQAEADEFHLDVSPEPGGVAAGGARAPALPPEG